MAIWPPHTWAVFEKVTAAHMNDIRDELIDLYPPVKVRDGQDVYLYYDTGGVTPVNTDGSGNFDISFSTPFAHAILWASVQSASGGSPFAVTVGALALDSISCHASALEGTVVTSTTLNVVWTARGY